MKHIFIKEKKIFWRQKIMRFLKRKNYFALENKISKTKKSIHLEEKNLKRKITNIKK